MKKIITILSFFVFLLNSSLGNAQVREKTISMSDGEQNAFYFTIETDDVKGIEKLWKKYFKTYGKMKKNKKEKEWQSVEPVVIPRNGAIDYDVSFRIKKENGVLVAYTWAFDGEQYVSSENTPEEAKKIQNMVETFAHKSEVYVIEKLLKEETKFLDKLEKELSKLEKKNTKYHKKIEDAKKKIIENEENIEQNIMDQKKTNVDIEDQRKRVNKIKQNLNSL